MENISCLISLGTVFAVFCALFYTGFIVGEARERKKLVEHLNLTMETLALGSRAISEHRKLILENAQLLQEREQWLHLPSSGPEPSPNSSAAKI